MIGYALHFAQMGDKHPSAKPLQGFEERVYLKSLTRQIYHRIQALGLTQREAGKRLGLKQPEVSKLMKGRFTDFPTDRLLALLKALEVDVDIVLRPHSEQNGHRGIVRVVEATA